MEVLKNSIYWKFQRGYNIGTWFKILKIYFALICASYHLACLSRAICLPQVVFCFLWILVEFLISKDKIIFPLHALIKNTNSGILSMVFCYMLLLSIWQYLGNCPLSGHNFLNGSALNGWCTIIIHFCPSTLGWTLICNNLCILETMLQCVTLTSVILLLAKV